MRVRTFGAHNRLKFYVNFIYEYATENVGQTKNINEKWFVCRITWMVAAEYIGGGKCRSCV